MSQTILKSDYERYLKEGGSHPTTFHPKSNGRTCNNTGKLLQVLVTDRSIWHQPFMGGSGEVRRVTHLYCEECDSKPKIEYGEPIYEDELMLVE